METLAAGTNKDLRMIMRNLAGNMVQDVSLRDTIGCMGTDSSHGTSEVTQKAAVESSEGTASKGEFRSTVVGQEGIGVLQEGDENKPVVDPEIGNEICPERLEETLVVNAGADTCQPERKSNC